MKKEINVDYLIIGAGISGLICASRLKGNVQIIDKSPFSYKIGESHLPNLIHCDKTMLPLIGSFSNMSSYTIKKGSVFIDKATGEKSGIIVPLGNTFAFHGERSEMEKIIAKHFNIKVSIEAAETIDFENNIVITNKNIYSVKKYIIDSSGFSRFSGKIQNNISEVSSNAKWGYWEISSIKKGGNSFSGMTILTCIDKNTWLWQIPLFGNSILSCGIVTRGKSINDIMYRKLVKENIYSGYSIKEISQEIKSKLNRNYLNNIFSRNDFSQYNPNIIHEKTILVGDAFCFADPVFSTGTGIAASGAIFLTNILNQEEVDIDIYKNKSIELLNKIKIGIDYWYNKKWMKEQELQIITKEILQGESLSTYVNFSKLREMHNKQIDIEVHFNKGNKLQHTNFTPSKHYNFSKDLFSIDRKTKKIIIGNILMDNGYITLNNNNIRDIFLIHFRGNILSRKECLVIGMNKLKNSSEKKLFKQYLNEIDQKGIIGQN